MEKNVLVAAGLVKPGEDVTGRRSSAIFEKDIRCAWSTSPRGELVPEDKVDARAYDQRAARNDPAHEPRRAGQQRRHRRGCRTTASSTS